MHFIFKENKGVTTPCAVDAFVTTLLCSRKAGTVINYIHLFSSSGMQSRLYRVLGVDPI